jgi:crossover junction endodeoxyribonuclease RuvC
MRYTAPMREANQRIVGIDPGAKGAIALIEGDSLIVRDMPTVTNKKGNPRVDPAAFGAILREFNPSHVWVEDVHSMPKQGVASTFAFGVAVGFAQGIPLALGFPMTVIGPAQWKSAMRCSADKNATRARASQLLPKHAHQWPLAKHDGRAEAALIALYGQSRGLANPSIEW